MIVEEAGPFQPQVLSRQMTGLWRDLWRLAGLWRDLASELQAMESSGCLLCLGRWVSQRLAHDLLY